MSEIVLLTEAEARDLTARACAAGENLAQMLLELHEGEAWRALGHASWGAYVEAELPFAHRQANYTLTQARAQRLLAEAMGGTSGSTPLPSRRDAAAILKNPAIGATVAIPPGATVREVAAAVHQAVRRGGPAPKPSGGKKSRQQPSLVDAARKIRDTLALWRDEIDPAYLTDGAALARILSTVAEDAAGIVALIEATGTPTRGDSDG